MAVSPRTQPSLLMRIRNHRDRESWSQFVEIYAPLVYGFLRKRGIQDADAADLTQDVMASVAAAIETFDYSPEEGRFRGWLFTVVQNRLRNFWRNRDRQIGGTGGAQAAQLLKKQPDPSNGQADEWDEDYERHLFHYVADRVRGSFQDATWHAFWRTAVEGQPTREVAESLGMTVAAVHLAKGRVIARIKQQIQLFEGE